MCTQNTHTNVWLKYAANKIIIPMCNYRALYIQNEKKVLLHIFIENTYNVLQSKLYKCYFYHISRNRRYTSDHYLNEVIWLVYTKTFVKSYVHAKIKEFIQVHKFYVNFL